MNEKIKELLKKAMVPASKEFGGEQFSLVDNEKFAELIIKECAEWIKNTDPNSDIGEEDAQALLDHFGVEE